MRHANELKRRLRGLTACLQLACEQYREFVCFVPVVIDRRWRIILQRGRHVPGTNTVWKLEKLLKVWEKPSLPPRVEITTVTYLVAHRFVHPHVRVCHAL